MTSRAATFLLAGAADVFALLAAYCGAVGAADVGTSLIPVAVMLTVISCIGFEALRLPS